MRNMKKEEFKQKTREVLDELVAHIDNLEQKAGEIAEDAKQEYREQLDKLKDIRDNLSSKLDEYENIADTKWDVVRESAGHFFATVGDAWKEDFGKIVSAFKKSAQEAEDETENFADDAEDVLKEE